MEPYVKSSRYRRDDKGVCIIDTEEHGGLEGDSADEYIRVFLGEKKRIAKVTPFSAEGDVGRFGKGARI